MTQIAYVRVFALAATALVAASAAQADVRRSTVVDWNLRTHQLTLSDRTQFNLDPAKVALPDTLTPGDGIEIGYDSDEDGVSAVHYVTVLARANPVPVPNPQAAAPVSETVAAPSAIAAPAIDEEDTDFDAQ